MGRTNHNKTNVSTIGDSEIIIDGKKYRVGDTVTVDLSRISATWPENAKTRDIGHPLSDGMLATIDSGWLDSESIVAYIGKPAKDQVAFARKHLGGYTKPITLSGDGDEEDKVIQPEAFAADWSPDLDIVAVVGHRRTLCAIARKLAFGEPTMARVVLRAFETESEIRALRHRENLKAGAKAYSPAEKWSIAYQAVDDDGYGPSQLNAEGFVTSYGKGQDMDEIVYLSNARKSLKLKERILKQLKDPKTKYPEGLRQDKLPHNQVATLSGRASVKGANADVVGLLGDYQQKPYTVDDIERWFEHRHTAGNAAKVMSGKAIKGERVKAENSYGWHILTAILNDDKTRLISLLRTEAEKLPEWCEENPIPTE